MMLWGMVLSLVAATSVVRADEGCETKLVKVVDNGPAFAAADFFEKNRRVPSAADLRRLLPKDAEFDEDAILASIVSVAQHKPVIFGDLKLRAAQRTMQFALARFRYPKADELAAVLGWRVEPAEFATLSTPILGERPEFLAYAREAFPEFTRKIVNRLVDAYLRGFSQRDVPKHLRTQKVRPSEEKIFDELTQARANVELGHDVESGEFTVDDLRRLIGTAEAGPDDLVVLDQGVAEIERVARLHKPNRFANFSDVNGDALAGSHRLLEALREKQGFLVTTVNAGIDLVEEQLATMLKYADDVDYDIIIMPTNQQTQGIDQRLLNHPRVHILSHTIQNRFFKLSNIPIMPKNENPTAGLIKRRQYLPGQLIFLGHPQLKHVVVPTSTNHLRSAEYWSPGSLSKNIYPYEHAAQGRTAYVASEHHVNSFLVVEKADAKSGLLGRGVENFWHPRPVLFKNLEKDERRGFTDMGTHYYIERGKVRVEKQYPDALVDGDFHEEVTEQAFLRARVDMLSTFPPKSINVISHDPFNGSAVSRHESDNATILKAKFASGELNLASGVRGLVQYDNALAALPAVLHRYYVNSNHTKWLTDLIDKLIISPVQSVVNGKILDEFKMASSLLGFSDPLEYLFRGRGLFAKMLPPDKRRQFEETEIPTHDPQNVSVIPAGELLTFGSAARLVVVSAHGDKGNHGARGSEGQHANANEWIVSGDSHRPGILGGAFTVGTSTPKLLDYNRGGYSAWGQSFALIYKDGTIQTLTYSSATNTMYARPGAGHQSPADFFGDDPLKIKPNQNEQGQTGTITDQHSQFYDRKTGGRGRR